MRATQSGALAREGLVYRKRRAIEYPPRIATISHFARRYVTSTKTYSQCFQASLSVQPMQPRKFSDRSNNATLKRLKLPTVTPGATSTLSPRLVLRWFSDAFSSSPTHVAINLQAPLYALLCQTPGSNAAVFQFPVMVKHPTSPCHTVRPLFLQLSRHYPLG